MGGPGWPRHMWDISLVGGRAGTRARAWARAVNGGQLLRSPSGCSTHATRGGLRGGPRVAPAYVGPLPLYTLTISPRDVSYTLCLRENSLSEPYPTCTFVGCVSSPELWSKLWWRLAGKVAVSQRF